jgi:hypothetical protein
MQTTWRQAIRNHRVAIPRDHGSWVFLLSPLLIGLAAGGSFSPASLLVVVAAMAAFLVRQPITIAVKVYSGRRPRRDLPAARLWVLAYSVVGAMAVGGLVALGFSYLLFLALPGLPVFVWHLVLVSRRAERRQQGVEIVASGVLALAAPAAFWVGRGVPEPAGWTLWILTWLQSAGSIVYAYLRLAQRELHTAPPLPSRFRLGRRALLYTTFNLFFSAVLAVSSLAPSLVFVPYTLQWLETLWGTVTPAIGQRPTRIGMRQLLVSSLFTLLFILIWVV